MGTKEIDNLIYQEYPRKVGKNDALKAISRAAERVRKESGSCLLEARRKLYKATKAYAASPAGTNPDRSKIPHPATFFNQGRYDDDPKEWQVVIGEKRNAKSGFEQYIETLERGERAFPPGPSSRS